MILLRWYSSNHKSPSATVIYAHGGGMILGSVKAYDKVVAAHVARTGVPFLAVDYRLAPEHPHPIPVNDVYAALNWLVAHSEEFGVDTSRIVLADKHLTPFLSWNTTDNETGWQALLGCSRGREMVTETAAPGRMVDATGMPPLYIEVGKLDLF
ncbi:lipase esterase [Fusarium denticulatum]|uniref:Lipase esterase n=1 Tax=Fusarium denticulatum TaxID=48507 RepID=A0A8H5XE36_9HYPO|nr:lipase esterase [Fusarium denticulatum]